MLEVFVILAIIAVRVVLDSLLTARAVANYILKEKNSGKRLAFWIFIYMTDLLLMTVGIACLMLLY